MMSEQMNSLIDDQGKDYVFRPDDKGDLFDICPHISVKGKFYSNITGLCGNPEYYQEVYCFCKQCDLLIKFWVGVN